jgi:hypothetical protein
MQLLLAAGMLATGATVAAAVEWYWLAVAAIAILQVALLAAHLFRTHAASSARRIEALSVRVVAAIETGRLEASDRHRELLDRLENRSP